MEQYVIGYFTSNLAALPFHGFSASASTVVKNFAFQSCTQTNVKNPEYDGAKSSTFWNGYLAQYATSFSP